MRSVVRMRRALVLGIVLACGHAPSCCFAQAAADLADAQPASKTIYYKSRAFRIPVTIPVEVRGLVREVRLWVSDDFGAHWKEVGQAPPDRPEFPFRASRDAEYWFALQTVDTQGKIYPTDDRPVEPSLRVVVDTAPPTLTLLPHGRKGNQAAVRWEMQDENLVLRTFALEYQPEGAGPLDWRSVPLRESDLKLNGAKAWDAGTSDPLRVRALVMDRAKNTRQVEIVLRDGLAAPPGAVAGGALDWGNAPPPVSPIASRTGAAGSTFDEDPFASVKARAQRTSARERFEPLDDDYPDNGHSGFDDALGLAQPARTGNEVSGQTLLVGSPRFPLQYEVADAGPAGVSKVQLWVTHDGGRTWYPQPEDADRVSPYLVDVSGEGTFGLWLSVQGVSGLGDPPPAPGDRPQIWVEVDSTPPVVQLNPPTVGGGRSAGKILITWRASDPHLGPRPVHLFYRADGSTGPWTRIAGPLENSGQFVWVVPPGVPHRFRIRIEVDDTLGHRGAAESEPVIVDYAKPKARIIGLDPSVRTGSLQDESPLR